MIEAPFDARVGRYDVFLHHHHDFDERRDSSGLCD